MYIIMCISLTKERNSFESSTKDSKELVELQVNMEGRLYIYTKKNLTKNRSLWYSVCENLGII